MSTITINGITLDPQRESAGLEAFGLASADAAASNYLLIQLMGPIGAGQKEQLEGLGVEVLEYVPENTLLCYFEGTDLAQIRALDFVAWANIYLNDFKIAQELRGADRPSRAANLLSIAGEAVQVPERSSLVDVVLHRGIHADEVRGRLAEVAGLDPEALQASGGKFRVTLKGQALPAVAGLDEVHHIEKVFEASLSNDVALQILQADRVHQGAVPLRGEGEVVAVCDTGFDTGSLANVHNAFANRVVQLYPLGRTRANDPDGHGTHVAGSVLGDGVAQNHGPVQGAAPAARLVLQSVLDAAGGLGGLPSDLNDLFVVPYSSDGARVHNNSWGLVGSAGSYTQASREVDDFVWQNRDFVICFAAGNPGEDANANGVIDLGSVQAPGTAKNCITVGASESQRPDISRPWSVFGARYPVEPIRSDLWADDPEGMAAFSGRGPTRDGRIKPDVVAPGTSILSAHSRDANVAGSWGPAPERDYCYMGGTSMATPLVAGCAAVIRQSLRSRQMIERPSAALVKAMLINGAVGLRGQYTPSEVGPIPNFSVGFGRVDLAGSLLLDGNGELIVFDEADELRTGDDKVEHVKVPDGASRLKATLVWTDPPGEALQNDLDLIVRAEGEERHGNMAPGSTKFDRTNNVEQILWDEPPSGEIQVIVRAHRVVLHAQSFALVVSIT